MPELKHTPGPWSFKKTRHSNGHVSASFLGTIEAPNKNGPTNWAVAAIWDNCGDDNKQSESNAKLIAAAPDLLEALRLCGKALSMNEISPIPQESRLKAIEIAHAAIAKATT